MTDLLLPPEFAIFGPDDVESIDWSDPVSDDPLNDGLVLWMLFGQGIPGGFGGAKCIDLTRRHIGTLTNMEPATDWRATSRQGGFGELTFDGSNDQVVLPDFEPANYVATVWFKPSNVTGYKMILTKTNGAGTSGNWGELRLNGSAVEFITQNGFGTANSTACEAEQWCLAAAYFSTTFQALVTWSPANGWKSSSSTRSPSSAAGKPWRIGGRDDSFGFFLGEIDDVRFLSRTMSTAAALSDYATTYYSASRQGYPGLLNRISLPRYSVQDAGGGGFIDNTSPILRHLLCKGEI